MINSPGGMHCTEWQTWSGGVETSSGWDCWYEEPGGGGGGGGVGYYTLGRDPNNQENVTCHSDGEGRYLSARQDFLKWKLDTRPTQYAGQGEVLKISYKGGGDEKYIWIPGTVASPTAPAEAMLARVPNTLNCP